MDTNVDTDLGMRQKTQKCANYLTNGDELNTYVRKYQNELKVKMTHFLFKIVLTLFSGVMFRFVTSYWGSRVSVMLGGFLAAAGLALCVVVQELYQLYLAFGLLTGRFPAIYANKNLRVLTSQCKAQHFLSHRNVNCVTPGSGSSLVVDTEMHKIQQNRVFSTVFWCIYISFIVRKIHENKDWTSYCPISFLDLIVLCDED